MFSRSLRLYSATITMQEVCSIMIKSITIYFLCKLQIDCMSDNSFSINFLRLNFREYESRKWGPSGGPGINVYAIQRGQQKICFWMVGRKLTWLFASFSWRMPRRHWFKVVIQCMCWGRVKILNLDLYLLGGLDWHYRGVIRFKSGGSHHYSIPSTVVLWHTIH